MNKNIFSRKALNFQEKIWIIIGMVVFYVGPTKRIFIHSSFMSLIFFMMTILHFKFKRGKFMDNSLILGYYCASMMRHCRLRVPWNYVYNTFHELFFYLSRVIVVEQIDKQSFNRAALLNIGKQSFNRAALVNIGKPSFNGATHVNISKPSFNRAALLNRVNRPLIELLLET